MRTLIVLALAASLAACEREVPVDDGTVNVTVNHTDTTDECPRADGQPCR